MIYFIEIDELFLTAIINLTISKQDVGIGSYECFGVKGFDSQVVNNLDTYTIEQILFNEETVMTFNPLAKLIIGNWVENNGVKIYNFINENLE